MGSGRCFEERVMRPRRNQRVEAAPTVKGMPSGELVYHLLSSCKQESRFEGRGFRGFCDSANSTWSSVNMQDALKTLVIFTAARKG